MARCAAVGVSRVVVPAVRRSGWPRLRALAAEFGWTWAIGTHPHALVAEPFVPDAPNGAQAIGECGLDGGVPVAMEEQERILSGHLALAHEAGLPVILHCWRAHHRLLPLLRRFGTTRGVLHSYSGGEQLVRDYVSAGLYLSFSGVICRSEARRPHAALRAVPRERLLLETDAPDQAPGGGRNEPNRVINVLRAAEVVRGEPLESVVVQNARDLGLMAG